MPHQPPLPVVIVSLAAIWLCCCFLQNTGQADKVEADKGGSDPIWGRSVHCNGPSNKGQERSKRDSQASSPPPPRAKLKSFFSPKNCGIRAKMPKTETPASAGSSKSTENRISGGTDVKSPTSWPFFGTLMGEGDAAPLCGAGILSQNLVITSATCGLNMGDSGNPTSSLRLMVGSHLRRSDTFQGQVVWARDSCTPSEYSIVPSINGANRSQFDFMLIRLEEELKFSANLSAACLIKQREGDPGDEDEDKPDDYLDALLDDKESNCFIIAHKEISSDDLRVRYAQVQKLKCWNEDSHEKLNFCFASKRSDEMVNVCRNDSGAPIFCRDKQLKWHLVGLVSTVMPDCQDRTKWGIYNVATSMSRMLSTGAFQECVDKLAG